MMSLVDELRTEEGAMQFCKKQEGGVTVEFGRIADRIEAEYDPKPEPDTVEKVAKDMAAYLSKAMRGEDLYASEMTALVRRAEALGVKVDD